MNEPLSWIWVAQVVVIIAAVAADLLAIMWVTLRGRPTWHHVITHEVNKSWEEVKVAIEARERVKGLKSQWVYHGTHDQRQNGSRADSGPSPGHDVRLQPRQSDAYQDSVKCKLRPPDTCVEPCSWRYSSGASSFALGCGASDGVTVLRLSRDGAGRQCRLGVRFAPHGRAPWRR
jgi:hypothetical protein